MPNGLSAKQAALAVNVPLSTLYRWRRGSELLSRRPHRLRRPQERIGVRERIRRLHQYPGSSERQAHALLVRGLPLLLQLPYRNQHREVEIAVEKVGFRRQPVHYELQRRVQHEAAPGSRHDAKDRLVHASPAAGVPWTIPAWTRSPVRSKLMRPTSAANGETCRSRSASG